jgi:phosphatidate cytidylyltransferase
VLRTRFATAVVAIPLLIWIIVWNPLSLFTWLVAGASFVGVTEYFAMAFRDERVDRAFGIVAGTLVVIAMMLPPDQRTVGIMPDFFAMALAGVVMSGLILALVRNSDLRKSVDAVALTMLGILYVAFLMPHYAWLHRLPDPVLPRAGVPGGWRWVVLTLVVAMAGDVGGYFGGRYYGRHKLMPEVSPGKTVEGTLAAFGGNVAGGIFCKLTFFPALDWVEVFALSLAAGCLAQVGDLCESMLKRAFGAKDSGWIIPGHGGVLDRIDSLVFPAPLIYYYARFLFIP